MSYSTGQLVWGAAKSIGNIWIVTDGVSRTVSLVFDGKIKKYCPDFRQTRADVIKPTSFLYELTPKEWADHTFTYGGPPQWAQDFIKLSPSRAIGTKAMSLPGGGTLSPAVVQKVQKALGVNLTPEPERVIHKDESKCPINGEHRYIPYTGLIQTFEYCVHCDKKLFKVRDRE